MLKFLTDNFISIAFNLSGIIFLTLVTIVYFRKKKYTKLENYVYRFLLILTLILLVFDIVRIYTTSVRESIPIINEIICRGFIAGNIVWFTTLVIYITAFINTNKYTSFEELFKNKLIIFFIVLSIFLFVGSGFLKIEYTSFISSFRYIVSLFASVPEYSSSSQILIMSGPAVYSLYISFGFVLVYLIYILLANINRDKIIKLLPIGTFLGVFFFLGILQIYYVDFNDLTYCFAFCIVTLYFTIENQDLKLVEELSLAKGEAEISDKSKTEFLMNMSHAIRTPMNVILGYSNLLINNDNITKDDIKRDNEQIYEASKTLADIINNILTYSKIESGKESVDDNEYLLIDIVDDLRSVIKSKIDENNVIFNIDISQDMLVNYKGDRLKLHRILKNLLNMYVGSTAVGKINLKIYSQPLDEKNHNIVFELLGVGTTLKKAFVDYLKNEDSIINDPTLYSKVDLDLLVSKRLIEILNGHLELVENSDVSCLLKICLRQEAVGSKTYKEYQAENTTDSSEEVLDCQGYRVLYVDDNNFNRIIMQRLLEKCNLEFEILQSGDECINKIKSGEKYDLIMLDHMMPVKDGIETLNTIKRISSDLPPVIAVTANIDANLKKEYFRVGFSDYLAKPVDIRELNRLLKKYLINKGGK